MSGRAGWDGFEAALSEGVIRRRIAAGLVDGLLAGLLVVVFWLAGVVFGVLTFGFGFGVLLLLPAVPVLYNWLFVGLAGATPGQRLFGLVVRRDEDLGPPDGGAALVWALGFALTMALSFGLLWLAVVLFTRRKRALHDIVPGLVVVRARALTPPFAFGNMPGGGFPVG